MSNTNRPEEEEAIAGDWAENYSGTASPGRARMLRSFFETYHEEDIADLTTQFPYDRRSIFVNWENLREHDTEYAYDVLEESPLDRIEEMEGVLEEYAADVHGANLDMNAFDGMNVRIMNLPDTYNLPIRDIRADHMNTLITISGKVRNQTDVLPKLTEAVYQCRNCGTEVTMPIGKKKREPQRCQGCENNQATFTLNLEASNYVDSERLKVQESPEGLTGSETPQDIMVPVRDDITGAVDAGDDVTITGVLKMDEDETDEDSPRVGRYLHGITIEVDESKYEDIQVTEEEREKLEDKYALRADEDGNIDKEELKELHNAWVGSLAPSIYGYDDVKLAICLQLMGGVMKTLPDGGRIRGNIHNLIIGDPGTGKSKMIGYVEKVAPRAVKSSGKGSSSAGLTAAAVQEDMGDGNEWTLKAGALVMANNGIAAVDELDKMESSDRSALHEALEQGEVSVAKAGINASLGAECSLLAAANPKYGRFDEYEPVSQQIDLEPALISRFDLIFTVTDNPDEEKDEELAHHILDMNEVGQQTTKKQMAEELEQNDDSLSKPVHNAQWSSGSEKKPAGSDSDDDDDEQRGEPVIDNYELRKYIAYAKQMYYPELTQDAKDRFAEFYTDLRSTSDEDDDEKPVPVTARKLEALVRLGEASARMRLSNYIRKEDADRVIELVRASMEDVGMDPETGEFDADMIETDHSTSQRERIKGIKDIVREHAGEYEDYKGVPEDEIIAIAKEEMGMDESKAEHEIEQLKQAGELYKPDGRSFLAS